MALSGGAGGLARAALRAAERAGAPSAADAAGAALARAARRAAPPPAGQPTPATHPELLRPGDVRPGLAAAEFARRRAALGAALPPGGLALLPAAPRVFMAGVIPYPYRPDADLQYLTGLIQPGVLAAVDSAGGLTLFVPARDAARDAWDGRPLGVEAAGEAFGAARAYPLGEARARLAELAARAGALAFDADRLPAAAAAGGAAAAPDDGSPAGAMAPAAAAAAAAGRAAPLRPLLHAARWRKSPAELALLRGSAALAAAGIADCMRASRHGVAEAALAALFEFCCRAGGAARMAYPPVVAGGADALTIHYSRADKVVPGAALLLLDGGCELHGYCSDVTRTWPAGGRFSGAQRALYEAVLGVHAACVDAARPGATLRQLHALSVRLLAGALRDLGLLGAAEAAEAARGAGGAYREFYPHSVGHWLGMDTHDCALVGHEAPLEPGVVLTVEPGLYVPDEPRRFGAFAGLGVRLEDVVAVRGDGRGAEVLSAGAPVAPAEVEALVRAGARERARR